MTTLNVIVHRLESPNFPRLAKRSGYSQWVSPCSPYRLCTVLFSFPWSLNPYPQSVDSSTVSCRYFRICRLTISYRDSQSRNITSDTPEATMESMHPIIMCTAALTSTYLHTLMQQTRSHSSRSVRKRVVVYLREWSTAFSIRSYGTFQVLSGTREGHTWAICSNRFESFSAPYWCQRCPCRCWDRPCTAFLSVL